MKILWISEFKVPTGFARVSQALVSRLNKKHDITVLDWYDLKGGFHSGVNVTGKLYKEDEFGINRMLQIYHKFDAIFILNDVWHINSYLAALKRDSRGGILPKIIVYFPVDAEMHNPTWYQNFDIVTHAVTYTKFAKDVISKAVPALRKHIKIIPHGVDTDIFYKSPIPKYKIREQLWGTKDLKDAFIFMTANRNAPRKRLDITIRAFAEFIHSTGVKDAWLHLHCGLTDYGIPIPTIIKQFNIDNRIMWSNKETKMQDVPNDMLNLYYNGADVGVHSSLGEGWGLTPVEHAMSGAAQIVPNHSALAENFKGRGTLVNILGDVMMEGCYTLGKMADYKHMAKCMEAHYNLSKNRNDAYGVNFNEGEKAREYFMQPKFNWMVIASQWDDLFVN